MTEHDKREFLSGKRHSPLSFPRAVPRSRQRSQAAAHPSGPPRPPASQSWTGTGWAHSKVAAA